MTRNVILLAALVFSGVFTVEAQATLTGKWQGETPNGAALALDLTVKASALTGTLTRNGESVPLSEGRISKNTFTFKATMNEQPEVFSGEFSKDEIKIWLERQGPGKAVILKRVKG